MQDHKVGRVIRERGMEAEEEEELVAILLQSWWKVFLFECICLIFRMRLSCYCWGLGGIMLLSFCKIFM